MNHLQNKCNISCHFLNKLVALLRETYQFKNVAIALPILKDKSVPNFHDNFVNC